MDRKQLVDKLTNDIKQLENKIEHRRLYNIRNTVVRALLKSGIAIDYALPFILAAIIIAHSQAAKGNAPFKTDDITEKAGIETIDTSNGTHIEHLSYDFSYDNEILEHSTGWIVNDRGLYQRTVTSYRLNDTIDLSDIETVLSMSKEEIDSALVVTNIKTIQKNTLSSEDYIYDEDALIIVNHTSSEEQTVTRPETSGENELHSIWFIILSLSWGNFIRLTEKLFVKTYMRDKLKEYKPLFRKINKEELEEMKKVLELRKQNLAMITPSENVDNENNGYAYRLRRA